MDAIKARFKRRTSANPNSIDRIKFDRRIYYEGSSTKFETKSCRDCYVAQQRVLLLPSRTNSVRIFLNKVERI